MTAANPIHYKILRVVFYLSTLSGVTVDNISSYTGLDVPIIEAHVQEMCDPYFSETWGNWLWMDGNHIKVSGAKRDEFSTGGFAAIEAASKQPYFTDLNHRGWKEEVLLGFGRKGSQSTINNAVLSTSSKSYTSNPEARAQRANQHFSEPSEEQTTIKEMGLRPCKCGAKLISTGVKRCLSCDRIRKRAYRRNLKNQSENALQA